jgi:rhamnosyltransferase
MIKMEDICFVAVVVTYNCDIEKLLESINSYKNIVKIIIVCDNSTNPQIHDFFSSYNEKQVEYHSMNGNKGIAHALNYGFKIATQKQADWVLTMDQDSIFQTNIEGYIDACKNLKWENAAILSPSYSYPDKKESNNKKNEEIQMIKKTIQSGCAYRLVDFQKIGPFREDFFIDYIDYDYCLRVYKLDKYIVRIPTVILTHNRGTVVEKNCFFFKVKIAESSPIRHYYQTRNFLTYFSLYHDYSELMDRCYLLARMIIIENNKLIKIKYTFMGIKDFFHKKRGILNNELN